MSATLRRGATNLPVRPLAMWAPYRYGVFSWLQQTDEQIADTIAFLRGEIFKGVTDGSDARPGEIGEFIQTVTAFPIDGTAQTQTVNCGVLGPGDWDVWQMLVFDGAFTFANSRLLPQPTGFSHDLFVQSVAGDVAEGSSLDSGAARALTSAPTLISFQVQTNVSTPGPAGTGRIAFLARRRR